MDGRDVALLVLIATPVAAGAAAWRYIGRARRPGGRPRARLLTGNLLVFAFLASVAALAGELWLRFVFDSTDQYGVLQTTDRWMERHYRFNNEGFRDDVDYTLGPVDPGRRRVTFVGDSFTAGHGVPDVGHRFANRVRAARPGWEVQVLASNGLDTGAELRLLEREMPRHTQGRYELDLVVLVYCLNDISDILPGLADLGRRVGADRPKPFLARHSYLGDTLRLLVLFASDSEVSGYFPSIASAYEGATWSAQRERLRRLKLAVTRRGGRLAVVNFPFLHELGRDDPFRDAHRRLRDFWLSEGVPCLDLRTAFEGREARDLVVGAFDAHPNEEAHALAAQAIIPYLDGLLAK